MRLQACWLEAMQQFVAHAMCPHALSRSGLALVSTVFESLSHTILSYMPMSCEHKGSSWLRSHAWHSTWDLDRSLGTAWCRARRVLVGPFSKPRPTSQFGWSAEIILVLITFFRA